MPPEEQITTVPYDGGESVEAVTGKVKRAIMVVCAAGLILTTGLVVAVDALARRRPPPGRPADRWTDPALRRGPPRYHFGGPGRGPARRRLRPVRPDGRAQ